MTELDLDASDFLVSDQDSQQNSEQLVTVRDQTDFLKTLEKLLFVIKTELKHINKGLEQPFDDLDWSGVESKVNDKKYKALSEFQDDFEVLVATLPSQNRVARDYVNFATKVIDSIYPTLDAKFKTSANSKTRKRKWADAKLMPSSFAQNERITLSKRTQEGVQFSSLATGDVSGVRHRRDIAVVNVVPTKSIPAEEAPTLATLTSNRSRMAPRPSTLKRPVREAAEFIDYGPFASFAPTTDSANASLSQAESSYVGADKIATKKAKAETVKEEVSQVKRQTPTVNSDENVAKVFEDASLVSSLKKNGLDIDALKKAAEKQHMDSLLEVNAKLLQQLADLQDERYSRGETKIPELERSIAMKLKENFKSVIEKLPPSSLTTKSMIRTAMKLLHIYEPEYKGQLTIPKGKPFPASPMTQPAATSKQQLQQQPSQPQLPRVSSMSQQQQQPQQLMNMMNFPGFVNQMAIGMSMSGMNNMSNMPAMNPMAMNNLFRSNPNFAAGAGAGAAPLGAFGMPSNNNE